MDFFAQVEAGGLPRLHYLGIARARGLRAALFQQYLKRFNTKLAHFKALALVNDLPVYDLTQAPLFSEANLRVLQQGADFQLLGKPARPISAVLAVTHACDCVCAHCSARDYIEAGQRSISFEELCSVIDQVLEMGAASIVLTGGEPTLHPRLLDLVARVPRRLAAVSMFTNGARLDRHLARELHAAGLFAAQVSLDAADAATHDRYRGREGAFAQGLRAIEALHEAGSLVGISSYISREGYAAGHLEQMLALSRRLDVHQLFLFDAVPSGAMREDTSRHLLRPEDRDAIRRRTMEENATHGGPGVMGQSWINSPHGFGCFAGFYQLYMTAAGEVTPCDFTPISFGNVREEPLERIWERLRQSAEWGERAQHCRMQDLLFRARSVDLIPAGTRLPIRYRELEALRRRVDPAVDQRAQDPRDSQAPS